MKEKKLQQNFRRTGPRAEWPIPTIRKADFGNFMHKIQKQQIYDFLAGNNYPDSPHSQGV